MNVELPVSVLVAAGIATLGVGWFVLVLSLPKTWPRSTHYGIYAALWLAYFISVIVIIGAVR